jgi:hypothetical protein
MKGCEIFEEEAVAGGAGAPAAPHELGLVRQADQLGRGAGGDDDRVGLHCHLVRLDPERPAAEIHFRHVVGDHLGAEAKRLGLESIANITPIVSHGWPRPRPIRPWHSQDWKATTDKALRNSDLFITLLSAKSVAGRGYFQTELREAIEILEEMPSSSIFIVPARLDECEPPQEALRKIFWVDLFPDYNAGVERILRAIAHMYGSESAN